MSHLPSYISGSVLSVRTAALDPPTIDSSAAEFVVLGESLSLSCSAVIQPHIKLDMKWEWPNQDAERVS